jgi:hypothetical protein
MWHVWDKKKNAYKVLMDKSKGLGVHGFLKKSDGRREIDLFLLG